MPMKNRLRWPTIRPADPGAPRASLAVRLGWMALIWLVSVGLLGMVAMVIRWVIR